VENPKITQEKEHIDLWIRDENNYALIIENKIHRAKDQENQLARYIENTVADGFKEEQIWVIYLPPTDEKDPDEQTWGEYEENFKERYIKLSFRDDILPWLRKVKENVLSNIGQKGVYLSSALEQYIDHLEGMFDLRTINNQMNMELQEFIKQELKIQENKPDDALETLAIKKEELKNAIEQIELLEEQMRKNCFLKWKEQLKKDFPKAKLIDEDDCAGLEIALLGTTIRASLEFYHKEKQWRCIVWNTKDKAIPASIITKVEHLLKDYDKNYPAWHGCFFDPTEVKKCYSLLKKVIEALIKK
jgi:hypothetical protein